MSKSNVRAILVLGMHRSGTSAIAGTIESAGAIGPKTQLPPNAANSKGYMESKPVMKFNDELLRRMNSTWDDALVSSADLTKAYRINAQDYKKALALLDSEYGQANLLVLKDPRMCRLLPFWTKALKRFDADILPVLALRNPMEVAQSLQYRDSMPIEKGLMLWLRHTLDAEFYSRKHKRVIAEFDDVIEAPTTLIKRLKSTFELGSKSLSTSAREVAFASPELRHQKVTVQHLANNAQTAEWLLSCFESMQALMRSDGGDGDALRTLDNIRNDFDRACRHVKPLLADEEAQRLRATSKNLQLEAELTQAIAKTEALEVEAQSLRAQFQDSQATKQGLESTLDAEQIKLKEVQINADSVYEQMQAWKARVDEAHDKARALEVELNAKNAKLKDVQTNATSVFEQFQESRRRLQDSQKRVETLEFDLRTRDRELAEVQNTIASLTLDLQSRLNRYRESKEQNQTLNAALAAEQTNLNEAQTTIAALDQEIHEQKRQNAELASEVNEQRVRAKTSESIVSETRDVFRSRVQKLLSPEALQNFESLSLVQQAGRLGELATDNQDLAGALSAEIHNLFQSLNPLLTQLSEFDAEVINNSAEVRQVVALLLRKLETSAQQLLSTDDELSRLQVDHARQVESVETLRLELLDLSDALADSRRSNQTLVRAQARRSKQIAAARAQHHQLEDVVLKLRGKVDAQSGAAELMKRQVTELAKERDASIALQKEVSSSRYRQQQLDKRFHYASAYGDYRLGYQFARRIAVAKWSKRRLLEKGLFEPSYYQSQLQETVIASESRLLDHYLRVGEPLGLQPHPLFDPHWYLETNVDAAESGQSALLHYCRYGSEEHRNPHILFDQHVFQGSLPHADFEERRKLDPISRFVRFGAEELTNPNVLFSSADYFKSNPDVKKAGMNPLLHYLKHGSKEGRSPSAEFNEPWYRKQYEEHIPTGMSALEFHFREGAIKGFATRPVYAERRSIEDARSANLKTILVVAHSASARIYGSERSLINVLSAIDQSKFRVVLALPNPSLNYIEATKGLVDKIVNCRHLWWTKDQTVDDVEVNRFEDLIRAEDVDLVYTNTIMLREPLIAARRLGTPTVCHVREMIDQDKDLTALIGKSPHEIIDEVRNSTDYIVGNSHATSELFAKKNRTFTIPNAVDTDHINLPLRLRSDGRLKVGMLSSNLAKKGVFDLYELAKAAAAEDLPIDFSAFGPKNTDTQRIEAEMLANGGSANLTFPGYVADAREALEKIDVVINLSRFAESFGRTAAEGMASRRPIIAYNRGALGDVILDGETGFLIEPDNPAAALGPLKKLLRDPAFFQKMAHAGRECAEKLYSLRVLGRNVNSALGLAIDGKHAPKTNPVCDESAVSPATPIVSRQLAEPAVTVIVPNYNYAAYLPERLNSILDQTHRPREIIFLDDCSTDKSLEVAEEILSKQAENPNGVPYRIIANEINQGVYRQWLRAFRESKTDWVWIAEADDTCEPQFLEKLTSQVSDRVNLVYAQSKKIDEFGTLVSNSYRHHTDDLDRDRWKQDFVESGPQEVLRSLAFRNAIPNTSAVIMRKQAIQGIEETLQTFRYTGDWLLYAHILRTGGIAFVSESLNSFRRHTRSVTNSTNNTGEYLVELARIRSFIAEHFPILPRHVEKQDKFLNRDYRIKDCDTNSQHPDVVELLTVANAHTDARKRIAIITTNNGSYNGGSEMLWQESAFALREQGHDVWVLIKNWQPTPSLIHDLFDAGVHVVFKEEGGFQRLLAAEPDLTIVSIGDQDEGTEYYEALGGNNLDYVIVNQLTKEARFWKRRANKQEAVKSGYLEAKKVFFTSKNNHRVMENRLRRKIPNADMHFNPYHIDRSIVPPYPETSSGYHVAVPSKLLFIHKGQDLLIDAMKDPRWRDRDIHFNLYGEGPDRENIEAAIRDFGLDNLSLKGRVSDISEIWRDNHALLMPSRMEGLPIMVVSALLSARMCIVTDIGGHAEVVRDGVSGFIVPDPSVADLSVALDTAYENREDWQAMGRRGRRDILKFLPEDPVSDFIARLEKVWSEQGVLEHSRS